MKFAIVDRKTNKALFAYESNKVEQRTGYFGGPWDDPTVCEHVKIPSNLANEPLDALEAFNGEEQDGTQMVLVGTEPAFDSNKKPIKGPDGQQVMNQVYEEQPVMKPVRLMRRKS